MEHSKTPSETHGAIMITPPKEELYDSFSFPPRPNKPTSSIAPDNTLAPMLGLQAQQVQTMNLPSPPISPWNTITREEGSGINTVCSPLMSDSGIRDPPLFSRSNSETGISADEPLFPPSESHKPTVTAAPAGALPSVQVGEKEIDAAVEQHIAAAPKPAVQPTKDEYVAWLQGVQILQGVREHYNRDPRRWLKQEQHFFYTRYGKGNPVNGVQKSGQASPHRRIAPAPATVSKISSPLGRNPRKPRPPRTPKASPRSNVYDSFDMSESPRLSTAAAAANKMDYESLPDYSPPLSTLPDNSKCLKPELRGSLANSGPLDLSHDPLASMLHPAELNLASALRLPCATYLRVKRLIFRELVKFARIGVEFKKTHCQQTCGIDVNKASSIWKAYNKVGWLDPKHVDKYV
ncbi:hypothetical protein FGG08_003671 [Glutinoglossum americanum]|uniref:SWIRM domain-containing protein n=1 Tax=Glutinoglossum americanum TaxID=1670608 RepID=A0A9P8I6S1_9PEZI|nr:hypothetical protein FGG08_003671 [Glutinoglossum americanum]